MGLFCLVGLVSSIVFLCYQVYHVGYLSAEIKALDEKIRELEGE